MALLCGARHVLMQRISRSTTCLLFNLQPIDDGRELAQNLVGLLVELHLRGDQLGQVAQRLGGVEDLFSDIFVSSVCGGGLVYAKLDSHSS